MTAKERLTLSGMRLARSYHCLDTARIDRGIGDNRAAANRAYYAVFHAMRAVLALDEIDMSKHSGIMAEFRRRYLKTDILPRNLSATITQVFEVRNASDYDDFFTITGSEADFQIEKASEFLQIVSTYLEKQHVSVPEY